MPGEVGKIGARMALNHLVGQAVPVVAASAPTWKPGLFWIDTSSGNAIKTYNGSAWVTSPAPGSRYLALLLEEPQEGAVLGDINEVATTGYARIAVTFTESSDGLPTIASNTGIITWGPMTVDMTAPATHAALVTVPSGTTGHLLYVWTLDEAQQVAASQSIQTSVGKLVLDIA